MAEPLCYFEGVRPKGIRHVLLVDTQAALYYDAGQHEFGKQFAA